LEGEISISIKVCMRLGWLPEKAIYREKACGSAFNENPCDWTSNIYNSENPGGYGELREIPDENKNPTARSKIIFD
jgi:hypothetical protein